ncbi:MAG TPA: type II secretion system protein GspL [Caldimonas sp.]|nr:type II secretion system protein GspL [Caldimonas sp.]
MSTLVLFVPPRARLHARGPDADAGGADAGPPEYDFVTTPDGLEVGQHGRCAAALLPAATNVVAVLADADVSWHRIVLPKAPASRLRAALVGLIEESLLDDADAVHLALAPDATAGASTWVAAVDRAWLRDALSSLQRARVFVDRVVPVAWPDDPPSGHFSEAEGAEAGGSSAAVNLTWAHVDGVACLRLQGGLARAVVPSPAPTTTRWSASPRAAAAAEQWLGAPVNVMPVEQRLLQAARSLWNLRQFDLAPRTRGARAVRDAWRRFMSPAWRPVRVGATAFVAAQLLGLNVWAWHQTRVVDDRRAMLQSLVKHSFPRVSDADIQRNAGAVMQREMQALRAMAGKPGDGDLEPLLQAAAAAWPRERPVQGLRYESGKLSLSPSGWTDAQVERFRQQLAPAGWRVDASEGRVVLSRARTGATS